MPFSLLVISVGKKKTLKFHKILINSGKIMIDCLIFRRLYLANLYEEETEKTSNFSKLFRHTSMINSCLIVGYKDKKITKGKIKDAKIKSPFISNISQLNLVIKTFNFKAKLKSKAVQIKLQV